MKVFVYYNLHKKIWSIKSLQGPDKGRVIAHSDTVSLKNAVGKVSEAGRKRVLQEKKKNVHAGIVGELVSFNKKKFKGDEITYNPYKYETFVFKVNDSEKFHSAEAVYMESRRVFVK